MNLEGLWRTLEETAIAETVRADATLYPLVETLHLLGVALVIGSIATLDLRLMGVSRRLPAGLLGRHVLRLVWLGFGLAVTTGLLLFATRATAYAENPAMQMKAVLLVLAGLNALAFHVGPGRAMLEDPVNWTPPAGARAIAVLSVSLWVAVAVCGQWIAYVGS